MILHIKETVIIFTWVNFFTRFKYFNQDPKNQNNQTTPKKHVHVNYDTIFQKFLKKFHKQPSWEK